MKLVVVGGHSRNIGKTSVAASVIAATRDLGWTALKLTQYGHHLCSADGRVCDCILEDPAHPFSITREESRDGHHDTSRFLAAGAAEAYWVRTPQGGLARAMPEIRRLIDGKGCVIMESNSVLRFLKPLLYLVVLDPSVSDFKASARDHLDRADVFLILDRPPGTSAAFAPLPPGSGGASNIASEFRPAWDSVSSKLLERRPLYRVRAPDSLPEDLVALLRVRLQS
ncbi:MAG TPA: hypothetical protein VFA54_08435 [Bryobacterales bacterium]|jgi:hypothetical protein|nr:hypothetical protein [Bryobacterales bacterium]